MLCIVRELGTCPLSTWIVSRLPFTLHMPLVWQRLSTAMRMMSSHRHTPTALLL